MLERGFRHRLVTGFYSLTCICSAEDSGEEKWESEESGGTNLSLPLSLFTPSPVEEEEHPGGFPRPLPSGEDMHSVDIRATESPARRGVLTK